MALQCAFPFRHIGDILGSVAWPFPPENPQFSYLEVYIWRLLVFWGRRMALTTLIMGFRAQNLEHQPVLVL